jgi:hypothetical protein
MAMIDLTSAGLQFALGLRQARSKFTRRNMQYLRRCGPRAAFEFAG